MPVKLGLLITVYVAMELAACAGWVIIALSAFEVVHG